MPRTEITVHESTRTATPPSAATTITATTIDATLVTNGLAVTNFFNSKDAKLIISNTTGSDKAITLVAGTSAKCIKKDIGNKEITITNATTKFIDQIESARFDSADGDLYVNFATGMTGTIYAIGTKHGGVA